MNRQMAVKPSMLDKLVVPSVLCTASVMMPEIVWNNSDKINSGMT
jgi:hypothetical protein